MCWDRRGWCAQPAPPQRPSAAARCRSLPHLDGVAGDGAADEAGAQDAPQLLKQQVWGREGRIGEGGAAAPGGQAAACGGGVSGAGKPSADPPLHPPTVAQQEPPNPNQPPVMPAPRPAPFPLGLPPSPPIPPTDVLVLVRQVHVAEEHVRQLRGAGGRRGSGVGRWQDRGREGARGRPPAACRGRVRHGLGVAQRCPPTALPTIPTPLGPSQARLVGHDDGQQPRRQEQDAQQRVQSGGAWGREEGPGAGGRGLGWLSGGVGLLQAGGWASMGGSAGGTLPPQPSTSCPCRSPASLPPSPTQSRTWDVQARQRAALVRLLLLPPPRQPADGLAHGGAARVARPRGREHGRWRRGRACGLTGRRGEGAYAERG